MPEKEVIAKKAKSYRNAFWAFLVLTYVIGKTGQIIKEQGGTDSGTAAFIIFAQALSPLIMIFCGIMWFKLNTKLKKIKTELTLMEKK